MPDKYAGSPNDNYVPGWDCDNPSKHAGGRKIGEGHASVAYEDFWDLTEDDQKAVSALREDNDGKGRTGVKTHW